MFTGDQALASQVKEGRTARYLAAFAFDEAVRQESGKTIGGIDEAGRGPLAGPVVAAAVVLPANLRAAQYYDSKQLSARARELAFASIQESALSYGIGVIDPTYIDQYNILQATYEAMRQAIAQLTVLPELFLVDGTVVPSVSVPQRRLIKGDALSQSVGAASIVAKVTRDRLMLQAAQRYPEYGFERHMGYGTSEHLKALHSYGPCSIHRLSFAPVRAVQEAQTPSQTFAVEADVRQSLGFAAEEWVVAQLQRRGWRLRERRYRVVQGEVDAVMEDGDTLVFVEVRARTARSHSSGNAGTGSTLLTAAESVDVQKREKLRRLAAIYVQRERLHEGVPVRFDVVAVAWARDGDSPTMEHYEAAF